MEIAFAHAVRYSTISEPTIREIAQSLIANEDILVRLPRVLERLYPELSIESTTIELQKLYKQSPLHESFNGHLYARFQTYLEDIIDGAAAITGINVLQKNKRAISSLMMVLMVSSALYMMLENITGSPSPEPLLGDYNVFLSIASDNLGRDTAVIEKAIQEVLSERDKRDLARNAADFAAPARRGGSVEIEGVGSLSSGAVAVIPDHEQLDVVEDEEFYETRENVEIYIRP